MPFFHSLVLVLVLTVVRQSYISYRQSFAHHPTKKPLYPGLSNGFAETAEESRRLISESGGLEDDGDAIIEMDLLPPRWVDMQDEVTELLADIAQKSAHLDKLHQKHLLPGFGDEEARKQEESVIERLTQEVTRGFYECQKSIQRIEMMVRESRHQGGGISNAEETMAKNIQISLAARVQEASARFRKKQSTYLKSMDSLLHLEAPRIFHIGRFYSNNFYEQDFENSMAWHRHSNAHRLQCRIPTRIHP